MPTVPPSLSMRPVSPSTPELSSRILLLSPPIQAEPFQAVSGAIDDARRSTRPSTRQKGAPSSIAQTGETLSKRATTLLMMVRMASHRHRLRAGRRQRLTARMHCELAEHAGHHVEQQMAVKRPAPDRRHRDVDADGAARRHDHRMLAWPVRAGPVVEIHPETVHVERMVHHRLVVEDEAHRLAFAEVDRGQLRILLVVE